jgi:hypothetical protein
LEESGSPFKIWLARWKAIGSYEGPRLPDEDVRVEQLLALWSEPIPSGWARDKVVARLLDPEVRYTRSDQRLPEHGFEYEVLCEHGGVVTSLGLPVVDAVNAIPLVKAPRGSRREGNVEVDMLLLVGDTTKRLHLIEAKKEADNAWYALVELLRALKLFTAIESVATQQLFYDHRKTLELPDTLPVTAFVLAPPAFYSKTGKREDSVEPAQRLIERLRHQLDEDVLLASWDRKKRIIDDL